MVDFFLYICGLYQTHIAMKRLTILFFTILCFGVLNAQETYSFRTDRPQGLSIESSTATGISLHYSIQEFGLTNINNGMMKGQEIILKGQLGMNAEGCPNLPVVNRYIAVPQGATVSLQYKENASTTIHGVDLLRAMPAMTDLDEELPPLRRDASIYGIDAPYPSKNIVVSNPLQIRSLDVMMLSITPFRYNPVRRTLEVIYDIDIDVRFEGGNGQFGESRYFNPDWRHILNGLVINSEMLPTANYYDLIRSTSDRDEEGAEYLIITTNSASALAWADTLKAFRTKQGILTKVVTTTECGGNNPDVIRNYIINAYNTWDVPPAAVLLFGGWYGNSGIKPFYHTTIQGTYNPQSYYTDYPYCDMNGDSIADVAVSRVTARNAMEYKTFVTKTIEYESHPYTDPAYYDRPILTTGHEANKWFLLHTQALNGFYRNVLDKHPTNLYMVHSGSIPDTAWSTGTNIDLLVSTFGSNGLNYIPDDVSELNDWVSKTDSTPLINALNEGAFLTVYRGHSNYNAWWFPTFKYYTLDNVVNAPNTYVLSVSCSCGIFTNSPRGMVESFCLKEDGGGIGGIGANALTHSYFNDILGWGIYDCIWPEFLPDLGSVAAPDFIRPAFVLAEAKNYLDYHFFLPNWWPAVPPSTKHLFNCIGETYLNLYTEVPQPLQVTHGQFMTANEGEFTVTADEGAVICLSQGDQILGVFQSDGQPHTFAMPSMTVGDQFTVTATKQNHFRYEATVNIVIDTGPFVSVEENGILAENNYGVLHNGEKAHVGLVLHNYGNNAASNVTMSLSCVSQYIRVTQGNCQYHNLGPHEDVTISDAFQVNIADNTPDMTAVTFVVHINDGNAERDFPIVYNIAAPALTLKPELSFTDANQQSMLQLARDGFTDIHVQIANEGHFDSEPYNLQLEMQAPFFTVEAPSLVFNPLQKGDTIAAVFRVTPDDNAINEGWLMAHFTLDDGIRQKILDTLLPYGGFNETFDEAHFNSNGWNSYGSAPWVITDEEPYCGEYCAKSGVITHNQTSSLYVTRTTPATDISFYKKISTENNYDKLHFYIDGEDQDEWSGSKPWSEERYRVSEGTHTFLWTYAKDGSVNTGADCVWIDNVNIFPGHTPIFDAGGMLKACKNESILITCNYAYEYHEMAWSTAGDGSFNHTFALHPIYTPGPQDNAAGGVTLYMSVDGIGSPLELILSDEIVLSGSITGDNLINDDNIVSSHYSIENQEGIDYLWQLEPEEAGRLFPHGNSVDVAWRHDPDITEATLSVSANNGCSNTISKTVHLDLVTIDEQREACFTVFPNPTNGKVNIIVGQELKGKSVVEVYNVLGHRMTSMAIHNLSQGQSISIDLGHYAPGLYIVKLCNDEGCWSQKVSVQ